MHPRYKNIFILGTGRCGTTSFIHACKHIKNYTSGHETRVAHIGEARLLYPDYHIEADNRLSWFTGRLEEKFGDQAFYVHLLRNPEKVAASLSKRLFKGGIITAYGDGILMPRANPGVATNDALKISRDYVYTVTKNIELFLKNKSNKMIIWLEEIEDKFPEFTERVGADANLEEIRKELKTPKNTSS
ncbi:hypothetical protein [Ectothiorhodospira mobilis]|uniref:hypothetical protein n=1 Tax=Ectothiorhodospira mobilis TaxID=195064 RepID=UPI0019039319|nr:hypothetical protein [Ectothiorhodospira mobilis]